MDLVTLGGLFIGLAGIIGGMILEGGHVGSIVQGTAAIIVFGGTIGAVLVSTTKEDLRVGLSLFKLGFGEDKTHSTEVIIKEMVEAAQIARRESILALDTRVNRFTHPFMRSVFRFVIDGADPNALRDVYESQIDMEEENMVAGAKIYADAGGFAPTIGIIGAVLGLIHVMSNLSDTSKLGSGIAVAFVATIYGIASANLFFIPLGNKIKRKIRRQVEIKTMILEGAISIMTGMNPIIIEEKLRSYVHDSKKANSVEAA